MNNTSFNIYHLNLDADLGDLNKSKSITKRIIDRTYNPMYWIEATHKFTLSGQYQYTNIRYTDGHQQNIIIIDENGKINKKYKMDDATTASYIRTELFKLISLSYDVNNFSNSRLLTQIIDHPYQTSEWRDGVTRKITLRTIYEGELTNEIQNRFEEYDRIKQSELQERIRKALEKKSFFEQSKNYNLDEQKFTNQLIIKQESPLLDSTDFYNEVIFPNQNKPALNHDFINTVKEFFKSRSNRYKNTFRWQMQITRPCHYKFGIDQISANSDTVHSNTFFLFFNDTILQSYFKSARPSKTTTQYIFKHALGLLYMNEYNEVNIDDIFFAMMIFIEKYFIQTNRHEIKNRDKGVEKEMSFIKLISNIKQMSNEISWIKTLNDIRGKSKNGCLFPDGWSDTDKEEWKEINGIERKEHSKRNDKGQKRDRYTMSEDAIERNRLLAEKRRGTKYKKSIEKRMDEERTLMRILELKKEGYSINGIVKEMGISKSTVQRKLKEIEKDRIN